MALVAVTAVALAACRVDDPGPNETADPAMPLLLDWIETLPYGSSDDQRVDVYHPIRPNGRALLWFHGGAFEYGSKDEIATTVPVILGLVNQGWTLVVPNYRFSRVVDPAGTDPDDQGEPISLYDARAAFSWLVASSPYLGVRADRIVAGGDSAGGTLAALLGTVDSGAPRPHAWMALDGPMDLRALGQVAGPVIIGGGTPGRAVSAFLGCKYDVIGRTSACDGTRMTTYSPIEQLDHEDPPGYLISGVHDDLVPTGAHALAMERRADEVGAWITVDVVDSGDPTYWSHVGSQWGANLAALRLWLDEVAR